VNARVVRAARGLRWILEGFRLFLAAPVGWLVLAFAYLAGSMLLSALPVIGFPLYLLLYPAVSTMWALLLVMPLVPIGTALLFPSTTSLMSRFSSRSELGTVMGTAQTFAGIARVVAPVVATIAFQRLGHGSPFLGGAVVLLLVGLLTFRLERGVSHPAAGPVSPAP